MHRASSRLSAALRGWRSQEDVAVQVDLHALHRLLVREDARVGRDRDDVRLVDRQLVQLLVDLLALLDVGLDRSGRDQLLEVLVDPAARVLLLPR